MVLWVVDGRMTGMGPDRPNSRRGIGDGEIEVRVWPLVVRGLLVSTERRSEPALLTQIPILSFLVYQHRHPGPDSLDSQ